LDANCRINPLDGCRVVEFGGAGLAGALAALLLAEQGADVVRVERPAAGTRDTPASRHLNAGKERRPLNLGSPQGRAEATQLLLTADVAIENFRPDTMERLGLSPDISRAANPALIYLRLPGFSTSDPALRDCAAWEGALGAACGLFTDVNIIHRAVGLPPVFTALPHASVYGAVHGALAVGLALLARKATGNGDVIEVPLAAAGASAMGSTAMQIRPQPRRYDLPEWPRMVSRLVMPMLRPLVGRLPQSLQQRIAALGEAAVPAMMSSYRCADGRLLYVFAVDHDRIPRTLLEMLALWPGMQTQGLTNHDPYGSDAAASRNNLADSTHLSRWWQARIRSALAARFATRPAAEWEAALSAAGIPCSVQRDTAEWLRRPELRTAGIVHLTEHGGLAPGPSVWLPGRRDQRGTTARQQPQPIPEAPARLSGRLVLDLTSMVAGPVCGRTLAEYGAEVLKVDSPRPHHGPRLTCWYGVDVNQGKRSMLLDLARPEGRAVLDRLLLHADVLLHNFTESACQRLHLRTEELQALNPQLVVMRIGAFLGPRTGPFDVRKAYDPVLQAASGIMLRYGGKEMPVHHGIASCVDYLTGYLAAWGVALALIQRARSSGTACEAATSLAQAAQLIQLPYCVADESCAPTEGISGQWARGTHALNRLYRARDGWIFLAAPPGARDRICSALGLATSTMTEEALAAAMARAIRSCRRADLATVLRDRQIAVVDVEPLAHLPEAPGDQPGEPVRPGATVRAVLRRGPGGEVIRTLAPTYALSEAAPLLNLAPAPRLGADTRAVLGELGLDQVEIERFLSARVASDGVSAQLLPD